MLKGKKEDAEKILLTEGGSPRTHHNIAWAIQIDAPTGGFHFDIRSSLFDILRFPSLRGELTVVVFGAAGE